MSCLFCFFYGLIGGIKRGTITLLRSFERCIILDSHLIFNNGGIFDNMDDEHRFATNLGTGGNNFGIEIEETSIVV